MLQSMCRGTHTVVVYKGIYTSPSHCVMVEVNLTSNKQQLAMYVACDFMCHCHKYVAHSMSHAQQQNGTMPMPQIRYTSQVTYTNPTNSGELLHSEPQNVHAVSAERPCSVHRQSVLCLRISVLSAAYHKVIDLQSRQQQSQTRPSFPKSLIIGAERNSPKDFEFTTLSAYPSQRFRGLFAKRPQTLREVSADIFHITALSHARICGLPIR